MSLRHRQEWRNMDWWLANTGNHKKYPNQVSLNHPLNLFQSTDIYPSFPDCFADSEHPHLQFLLLLIQMPPGWTCQRKLTMCIREIRWDLAGGAQCFQVLRAGAFPTVYSLGSRTVRPSLSGSFHTNFPDAGGCQSLSKVFLGSVGSTDRLRKRAILHRSTEANAFCDHTAKPASVQLEPRACWKAHATNCLHVKGEQVTLFHDTWRHRERHACQSQCPWAPRLLLCNCPFQSATFFCSFYALLCLDAPEVLFEILSTRHCPLCKSPSAPSPSLRLSIASGESAFISLGNGLKDLAFVQIGDISPTHNAQNKTMSSWLLILDLLELVMICTWDFITALHIF